MKDFTYDEAGTNHYGLVDSGKAKIKNNPNLILPKEGPNGEAITALGAGVNNQGIFVVSADDKITHRKRIASDYIKDDCSQHLH